MLSHFNINCVQVFTTLFSIGIPIIDDSMINAAQFTISRSVAVSTGVIVIIIIILLIIVIVTLFVYCTVFKSTRKRNQSESDDYDHKSHRIDTCNQFVIANNTRHSSTDSSDS